MEQVIIGGRYSVLGSPSTFYNFVHGGFPWTTLEAYVGQIISTGGKIKNLRIVLDGSPGSGKSYTFAIMINGSPSGTPTVTISDLETSGADVSTEKVVSAGDVIYIRFIPSGSPTARYATWTIMFEGDNANESLLLGGADDILSKLAIEYNSVSGSNVDWGGTEVNQRQVIPTGGVIKNLFVQLHQDPGTASDAYRFTLRLANAGNSYTLTNTALTVTITTPDTTGFDTANDIRVEAGDIVAFKCEPLNTPGNVPRAFWGFTFVADTDGESLIMGGTVDTISTSATEYNSLSPYDTLIWTPSETERIQLAQACVLKRFYVLLSGAPGSGGDNYVFTIRRNETSPGGGLVVTITDAATTGNDVSNTITVVDDDTLDLECNPGVTPTARVAYWGLVSYIDPAVVGLENKSANMAAKMMARGFI